MALIDVLNGKVADIEAQIKRVKDRAAAEVAALEAKKASLLEARPFLTNQAEKMIEKLQKIGILTHLS